MDKRLFNECDEKCLRDEPAACTACCPMHVDIALFAGEIAKGDYRAAYKVLEKRLPFAGIFAMICDHPCESPCVRDMPIRISELEKAAVTYGNAPRKRMVTLPKKKGNIAVVGGGISGLSAAFELNKKGYNVTIYEQTERLGGRIWDFEGKRISRELIIDELRRIGEMEIKLVFNRKIHKDALAALTNEYDAVYLGTGTWAEYLPVESDTFQVSNSSVFAGGRLLGTDSVILSVSTGKRAAISIERYTQRISLTASREREGSFETPMRYNTEGIASLAAIELTGAFYTKEEAANEAERCLKCRCDECVKACVHLRKFDMAPKAYARQILINDDVIMGTRYANTMINSCAMCGLCGERCPQGIDMREIVREARASMVENGKMPPSAHDFALRDMEFCAGGSFFTVKKPPAKKGEAAPPKADYLFYPGCQLPASCPEHVERAYHYLLSESVEAKLGGVGLMLGCCGAPADWAGRRDMALENIEKIRSAWEETGKPVFILACTSCMNVFERYLPEIKTVSLWEIMNDCGLEAAAIGRAIPDGRILHIHDACGARHNASVQDSVRHMVTDMGYKIKELEYSRDKTKCCGYGGMVFYANRDEANDFVDDRIRESPEDLIVYCAMCKDLFASRGKRTYHILDLVFAVDPETYALKKMPSLSDRRANRAVLKKKLLQELWKEDMDESPKGKTGIVVSIPQDVLDAMEERYILFEDVEDVLEYSRRSGQRFLNTEDSSFLAGFRKKNQTYWVRWVEKEDGVHIVSVYSHRMAVSSH